ncbi:MAG: hypothetical protein DMD81_03470 [Candidatus Rokuibacteriota bacterium]|nr:MAG: hypothetical protein DMD81_03470 [Candidatus Rokubacteria bacterium]
MARRSSQRSVPRTSTRISRDKVLENLRLAGRKGDRTALSLAIGDMRMLALTPRYWEKYLRLLGHPLARLVDLLVLKQGERIAHLKGWKKLGAGRVPTELPAPEPDHARGRHRGPARKSRRERRPAVPAGAATQPSLFE